MQPKTPKWLEDVRDAAAFILDVTGGQTLEHYLADRLRRQAVERNFEIAGEALRRIATYDPETAALIGDTPRIIAFRNILAHGYDTLDHEVVWNIVQADLAPLLAKVEALLKEAGA